MNGCDTLAELDGLIGELNCVSSTLSMLTLLIDHMDGSGAVVPNRTTFVESMNAVGYHLDRISKDAAGILGRLLEIVDDDAIQARQKPSGAVPGVVADRIHTGS